MPISIIVSRFLTFCVYVCIFGICLSDSLQETMELITDHERVREMLQVGLSQEAAIDLPILVSVNFYPESICSCKVNTIGFLFKLNLSYCFTCEYSVFAVSVKPIRLPNVSELWNQFVGHSAVAAGFGKTSDRE